jgi:hypothetical protein
MALNNKVCSGSRYSMKACREDRKELSFIQMNETRQGFDIAIAWNWDFDSEFLQCIDSAATARGLTTFFIDQQRLAETVSRLHDKTLFVRVFLDRASDEDERFLPLANFIRKIARASDQRETICIINPHDLLQRASDKATMHLEFLSHGIHVPYTIIISPYNHRKEVELSLSELAMLGRPFIIKPANTTGGGVGVVLGAESLKDVIETRQHHKNDKYLLQEKVIPVEFAHHRGWFRVFYAFGLVLPCWWNDETHIYEELTPKDEEGFGLQPLRSITATIQQICGLDFFSTEIAMTPTDTFVVVDYVNEMCDMRLQSRHPDGVPDTVVRSIAEALVDFALSHKNSVGQNEAKLG